MIQFPLRQSPYGCIELAGLSAFRKGRVYRRILSRLEVQDDAGVLAGERILERGDRTGGRYGSFYDLVLLISPFDTQGESIRDIPRNRAKYGRRFRRKKSNVPNIHTAGRSLQNWSIRSCAWR